MKEEKLEDFKPNRWIELELREPPSFMTLYPHISLDDIDLSCIGELPEPKLFQVDVVEIEQ